jgi:hypothetical protein
MECWHWSPAALCRCCHPCDGAVVADDWDRRCLMDILAQFVSPNILKDGHKFSASGIYYAPPLGNIASYRCARPSSEICRRPRPRWWWWLPVAMVLLACVVSAVLPACRDYAKALPMDDEPEIFGMHPNANISFQAQVRSLACANHPQHTHIHTTLDRDALCPVWHSVNPHPPPPCTSLCFVWWDPTCVPGNIQHPQDLLVHPAPHRGQGRGRKDP